MIRKRLKFDEVKLEMSYIGDYGETMRAVAEDVGIEDVDEYSDEFQDLIRHLLNNDDVVRYYILSYAEYQLSIDSEHIIGAKYNALCSIDFTLSNDFEYTLEHIVDKLEISYSGRLDLYIAHEHEGYLRELVEECYSF
jgi:hypothetical protein